MDDEQKAVAEVAFGALLDGDRQAARLGIALLDKHVLRDVASACSILSNMIFYHLSKQEEKE